MRRISTPRLRLGRSVLAAGGGLTHTLAAAAAALAFSAAALAGPVTLAATGLAVATGIADLSTGGSYITPGGTMSRTSGAAPLAVHFDASATVASFYTLRPFHDLEFRTEFGDGTASTWAYGAQPGVLLKNIAYGMVCAHVYESAGTYSPTTQIRYRLGDGSYDTTTYNWPVVTVTAGDTEWAGSKTYTYSTNTDHTGAPSGAVQISNVTDIAAAIEANLGSGNRRHLLRAGQTFPAPTNFLVNVGGGANYVGKFGSGANPIWNKTANVVMMNLSSVSTPTQVNDWRFVDIDFEGNSYASAGVSGEGACSQILFLRCAMQNISYGFTFSQAILDGHNSSVPFTHALWDQMYFVDSSIYNLIGVSGPCGIFASWNRAAVMGCSINNNGGGEHGCRTQFTHRQVFSNNTVQGIAATKANFSIRGGDFAGTNTLAAGQYSEKNIVSDNLFVGGLSGGILGIGPQNSFNAERGRDMIIERNWFTGSTNNVNTITVAQPDITIRNNVFSLSAGLVLKIERSALVPPPTRIGVHNNSGYSSQSGQFIFISQAVNPADWIDVDPGDILVNSYNNLFYTPSASGISTMWDDIYGGGTLTASNNSSDSQIRLTSPSFTTTPPTTIAHFKPTGGYAVAGGTLTAKVYRDILGVAIPSAPDIGAVVH